MPSSPVQSVTSAPVNARVERAGRTRRYLAMMGVRTLCFVAAFFVEGWLRWTCVVLAVVLPYVAVVLANSVRVRPEGEVHVPTVPDRHQLGR